MQQQEFDRLVEQTCSVTVTDPTAPLVDLGVDSLHTIALVMAVEEAYGIEFDPDTLTRLPLTSSAALREAAEDRAAATALTGTGN
ncbi:acyl carrier protein [Streptomyces sp. NPDC058657]|uniref:acyl carrier protein n=1 Tax=unclassified Streptomyces TaxID=2593676 RepID=UPI00365C4D82